MILTVWLECVGEIKIILKPGQHSQLFSDPSSDGKVEHLTFKSSSKRDLDGMKSPPLGDNL